MPQYSDEINRPSTVPVAAGLLLVAVCLTAVMFYGLSMPSPPENPATHEFFEAMLFQGKFINGILTFVLALAAAAIWFRDSIAVGCAIFHICITFLGVCSYLKRFMEGHYLKMLREGTAAWYEYIDSTQITLRVLAVILLLLPSSVRYFRSLSKSERKSPLYDYFQSKKGVEKDNSEQ
jgi:hypothetical protein